MSIIHVSEAVLRFDQGAVLPTGDTTRLYASLRRLVGKPATEKLLATAGATGVSRMPSSELAAVSGVSERLAKRVVAARDFGDGLTRSPSSSLRNSRDVAPIRPLGLERFEVEVMLAVALTSTLEVKALVLLAVGGSTGAALRMRDILAPLLRLRAHAFVLVHNHPGGTNVPSPEDVALTNRVAKAGFALDLDLVDHLIVSSQGTFSFRDHDLMPTDTELGI